ncbi:adenylate/guanylate cyclase domain-containing protein [Variovorax sp. OV329]|uniref:ATP-binding protein n=1 Tax=Variovorax sp. OV329 TaxID=1882825 RepID=UPI0008E73F64|nr:adenylate/guanylate cyclase domain-containing protein [Variovorax sp. OV329]SFM33521.1 Predicted ATPase [Variovorax sp. OV329]
MSSCPNCGAPREANHRFCPSCGARLDAQRELKQVTVLLADLCGSTEQVVRTDAEGGQAYLDQALRLMSEAVSAYGGTQVQWRGDELLALFGAPVAQEDHALRACLAAVAMIDAMKARSSPDSPMAVRIGIDSGEVIAGPGSGDLATSYRVDGAPVHLASRLEKLAPPASAYISGNTQQMVRGQVDARALGERVLRGFSTPVELFELAGGLQDSAAGPLARRRFLGPMVGRTRDFDALARLADEVRRTGLRTVGVRGDAGIGKSRLLAELLAQLGQTGFTTVSVTARSYASQAPYSLVADIVRALQATVPAGAGASQTATDAAVSDPQADALHAAALADLLGTGQSGEAWKTLTPNQRREHLASTFVRLVHASVGGAPAVLLLEDIFLADSSSLRLLESLPRRLKAQPLLILMSYRPDFSHRWNEAPWFVEHCVAPLAAADLSSLADELLGGDPSLADTRAALLERAGGNPLFLEQLVMTLVDAGSLLGSPGAYRRAPAEVLLRVPASIQTIIGARVDRLPEGVKASLEAAAVIGEPIDADLVAAVRDVPRADAERHLRHAMSGGLVASDASGSDYAFRHGLVQESVLASLTRIRRRQLHQSAFEAYQGRATAQAPVQAAVLAHHAFHGEQWQPAAEYALRAMARSIERSENKDALRVFELGLDAARRIEAEDTMLSCELALRVEALGAQMALGQFDAIVSNLERAESITLALGDTRRQAAVSLQLAVTLWARGSYEQGLSVATQAGQAAEAAGSRSLHMAATQARMMLHHGLGRYVEATEDAMAVARDFEVELQARRLFPGWAVMASTNLHAFIADIMTLRGDLKAAQMSCDAGYAELEEQDHPFSRVLLDFSQGELLLAAKRPAEAAALFQTALEMCRTHEISNMYPAILAHLGGALALAGRPAEALALLEPAVAQKLSRAGGRYNEYYFPYFHGIALQAAGRLDEALAAARQACEAAASFKQRGHEARSLLLLATLEQRTGREHESQQHLAQALALARACGMEDFMDQAAQAHHA